MLVVQPWWPKQVAQTKFRSGGTNVGGNVHSGQNKMSSWWHIHRGSTVSTVLWHSYGSTVLVPRIGYLSWLHDPSGTVMAAQSRHYLAAHIRWHSPGSILEARSWCHIPGGPAMVAQSRLYPATSLVSYIRWYNPGSTLVVHFRWHCHGGPIPALSWWHSHVGTVLVALPWRPHPSTILVAQPCWHNPGSVLVARSW